MAVNLNPGADASLVAQSYRMGMAGVPQDLSKTFQGVADSYSDAMVKVGAAAAEAAKVVGQVAGVAVKNALHISNMKTRAGAISNDGTQEFVTSTLEEVKTGLKTARKLPPGADRRVAVMKAKKERDNFFAEVQALEAGDDVTIEKLKQGLYDKTATGTQNLTLATAISLQGEPIKEGPYKGYYAKLQKNENGDLGWGLVNTEGKAVSKIDKQGNVTLASSAIELTGVLPGDVTAPITKENKQIFVGTADVNNLLRRDAVEEQTALNAIDIQAKKDGIAGLEVRRNVIERDIDAIITEENLPSLFGKDVGNMDTTFMQDLTKPSSLSANVWAELQNIGLEDTSGDGKIDAADFADADGANYNILKDALTDPSNENYDFQTSKEVFSSWYADSVIATNADYKKRRETEQARINALNKPPASATRFGLNPADTYATYQVDNKASYVKNQEVLNTVDLFKRVEDNSEPIKITFYTGSSYEYDGKNWFLLTRNEKDTEKIDRKKIGRETVLNDLGWLTNPGIMEHVGASKNTSAQQTAAVDLGKVSYFTSTDGKRYMIGPDRKFYYEGETVNFMKAAELTQELNKKKNEFS